MFKEGDPVETTHELRPARGRGPKIPRGATGQVIRVINGGQMLAVAFDEYSDRIVHPSNVQLVINHALMFPPQEWDQIVLLYRELRTERGPGRLL